MSDLLRRVSALESLGKQHSVEIAANLAVQQEAAAKQISEQEAAAKQISELVQKLRDDMDEMQRLQQVATPPQPQRPNPALPRLTLQGGQFTSAP